MVDLQAMAKLQVVGAKEIQDLPQVEQDALIGYSALAARDLMRFAQEHNVGTWEVINNAFRFGLSLGLNMKIENGQVKER